MNRRTLFQVLAASPLAFLFPKPKLSHCNIIASVDTFNETLREARKDPDFFVVNDSFFHGTFSTANLELPKEVRDRRALYQKFYQ
jgi:hypothetical protein